jgi:protein-S-isoprenylcysteine O-methyltransferase Ste14
VTISIAGNERSATIPRIVIIVGIVLALSVSALAKVAGFDRDKAFYPTLVAVVASYYVLFAVMNGSIQVLLTECAIVALFLLASFLAFKVSLWFAVVGLAGHGLLDFIHAHVVSNPGVPPWWPSFCGAYDIVAAGFLACLLRRSNLAAAPHNAGLELRIPPPLICAIVADLMWLTALVAIHFDFDFPGRLPAAAALSLLGLFIAIAGVVSFKRAKTTVNPTRPDSASTLVVSGVYRFTRNPMYLGLLIVLLAWGVFLANALALIWIPAFVVYMNRFQISPEERALSRLFLHEFPAYKARVRRWI